MAWTTYEEVKFRELLSPEAAAKLAPMPERLARLLAERRPYQGVERRSPYSMRAREVVKAAGA